MELKLGKMTSKEIAAWMGLSYNTYRNNIDNYLERLELYADFEKVFGGVIIKDIYVSIYNKQLAYENDKLFLKEVANATDNLTSILGMRRKHKEKFGTLSDSAIDRQLAKSRDKLFGKIPKEDKMSQGICGVREYVWAVKVSDFNEYRLLNTEEEVIFNYVIKKTYNDLEPEKIKEAALLEDIFLNSDMSKEDYKALREVKGYNFFDSVISTIKNHYGIQLVRVNRYALGISYDQPKEDREYAELLFKELN